MRGITAMIDSGSKMLCREMWREHVPDGPFQRGGVRRRDDDDYVRMFRFVAAAYFGEFISFFGAGNRSGQHSWPHGNRNE